jgi:hypothetical protein
MAGGKMLLFSTSQPADADSAQTGLLATISAVTFTTPSVNGVFNISGVWSGGGSDVGVARSFRYCCDTLDSGLTLSTTYKRIDGYVTEIGGGGDATVDNASISIGQAVTVTDFLFGINRG